MLGREDGQAGGRCQRVGGCVSGRVVVYQYLSCFGSGVVFVRLQPGSLGMMKRAGLLR